MAYDGLVWFFAPFLKSKYVCFRHLTYNELSQKKLPFVISSFKFPRRICSTDILLKASNQSHQKKLPSIVSYFEFWRRICSIVGFTWSLPTKYTTETHWHILDIFIWILGSICSIVSFTQSLPTSYTKTNSLCDIFTELGKDLQYSRFYLSLPNNYPKINCVSWYFRLNVREGSVVTF